MRARGVWLAAAISVLASAPLAWSMELRDMPPWLRDMIEPVHVTTPDGEASAETAGVHVWATQGAIGGRAVAPPDMPPVVLGATEDRPTAAVTSPGAITAPGTGPVSLSGVGAPPVGGVRAPSAADLTTAGVTISPMAAEWDTAVGSIEGLAREDLALAGRIVSMLQETQMSEQEFVAWAEEQSASPRALSAAYRMLTRERPYWNNAARTVCAALAEMVGPQLERLDDLPMEGRPGLAIYLGMQECSPEVRTVLSSIPGDTLDRMRPNPYYIVASTLLHAAKSLRTAIWAWKTEACRLGVPDRAHVCWEIRLAAAASNDPHGLMQSELIPWAEEALSLRGSEPEWSRALTSLLWAYDRLGRGESVIARGRYWLAQAEERGVPGRDLITAKWTFAAALVEAGLAGEAADVFRDLISLGLERDYRWTAETAQMKLLLLAREYPAIGEVAVLPPRLQRVYPPDVAMSLAGGDVATACVSIAGNPCFRITDVAVDAPLATATLSPATFSAADGTTYYRLSLHVLAPREAGHHEATVLVTSNDAGASHFEIPLAVDVMLSAVASPTMLFFGLTQVGDTPRGDISISWESGEDSGVTAYACEDTRVHLGSIRRREGTSVIPVAIDTSEPGIVNSSIVIRGRAVGSEVLAIPVYAHIMDAP